MIHQWVRKPSHRPSNLCFEPWQKQRARFGPRKTGLSAPPPPRILRLTGPRRKLHPQEPDLKPFVWRFCHCSQISGTLSEAISIEASSPAHFLNLNPLDPDLRHFIGGFIRWSQTSSTWSEATPLEPILRNFVWSFILWSQISGTLSEASSIGANCLALWLNLHPLEQDLQHFVWSFIHRS